MLFILSFYFQDTSRPPKIGDVHGKDFFFISQAEFKSDINTHKFVEYGQYEDEFFGTSIDAIRDVIKKNKVCVLNLHCQVYKLSSFRFSWHTFSLVTAYDTKCLVLMTLVLNSVFYQVEIDVVF